MKNDYSYGIIPLRQEEQKWFVLLVQHHAGHWAFPKGHADVGESPRQAAERELLEETGLKVHAYLSDQVLSEHYYFTFNKQRINKVVDYFVALVEGDVTLQEDEIQASCWLPLSEAIEMMTFKEGKDLILQIQQLLRHNPS